MEKVAIHLEAPKMSSEHNSKGRLKKIKHIPNTDKVSLHI